MTPVFFFVGYSIFHFSIKIRNTIKNLAAGTSFDGHCRCGEVAIDEQFKYEGMYMTVLKVVVS